MDYVIGLNLKGTLTEQTVIERLLSNRSSRKAASLRRRDELLNTRENLAKIRIPSVLYSVIPKSIVSQVRKQGLRPGQSRSTSSGSSLGVYLTDSPVDTFVHQDFRFPQDEAMVVKVRTGGLSLRLDPEYFYYEASPQGAAEYIASVNEGQDQAAFYAKQGVSAGNIVSITPLSRY